jgi:hypothetical protein
MQMQVYVQYRERGDITLVWTEDAESQGHVFEQPQSGLYEARVALPLGVSLRELATLPGRFRVVRQDGRITLMAK